MAPAMTPDRDEDAAHVARHVTARYDIRVRQTHHLDRGVFHLRMAEGPDWVARVFPSSRDPEAVAGDAATLGWLEEHDYPAERCATPDPVSQLAGSTVLVTEYVATAVRGERREAVRAAGGLRRLGELLAVLHTLPQETAPRRAGGAWHHAAEGHPAREVAAAQAWLMQAVLDQPDQPRVAEAIEQLLHAFGAVSTGKGLPEVFTHPDFVLANVVATPEPAMVLVDWTGAGQGPRAWSLAFLLWVEGVKDIRRAQLVAAGYRRHIRLHADELDQLDRLMCARPLVLDAWRLSHGHKNSGDAVDDAQRTRHTATQIADQVRPILDHGHT